MIDLFSFLRQMLHRLGQHHKRLPHGVGSAALALVLACGGAYALAAAVASMGPDPAALPVREVRETLTSPPVMDLTAPMATTRYTLYRSELSRSGDTAASLARRLGVRDQPAEDYLRRDTLVHRHLLGRAGRNLTAEVDDQGALLRLTARWSPDDDGSFKRLVVERAGSGFQSRLETDQLRASVRIAGGVIESSLFASADEAQLPEAVAVQLAEIFSGDIDFHRELRKGDRYSVVYEMLEGDGEPLRAGRILSAEFVNAGKVYQAVWFHPSAAAQPNAGGNGHPTRTDGRGGGYYTLDGKSLRRAYLASPLAFSRVTSGFKMRFHPILQRWAAHLGVDYAAPVGTPVRAVGDGVVEFAGVQGGYGHVVFVRHRNNHVTVYAHLSRIGVRRGQSVTQGQTIGATGATGWATGPHLHYEFRINGRHQNPLTVARNSESVPVAPTARPAFDQVAAIARQQLAAAQWLAAR